MVTSCTHLTGGGTSAPRIRLSVLSLGAYLVMSSLRLFESSAILPAHILLKEGNSKVAGNNGGGERPDDNDDDDDDGELISGFISATNNNRNSKGRGALTRLRPSPSDDLPILPLKNFPESSLPTDADIDPVKLSVTLGDDFDREFLSAKRPLEMIRQPNGTYKYDRLKSTVKLLPFSLPGFNEQKTGSTKKRGNADKVIQIKNKNRTRQFENYLAAYSACPVKYKWKDLGARFWPRWIKEGHCGGSGSGGDKRRSCSIPAGMTCKTKHKALKTVLWWHCKRKTGQKNQCTWISIKYPVIVRCKCSC